MADVFHRETLRSSLAQPIRSLIPEAEQTRLDTWAAEKTLSPCLGAPPCLHAPAECAKYQRPLRYGNNPLILIMYSFWHSKC